MDFSISSDQQAYVETARQFARAEFAPHAALWDAEQIFPVEAIRKGAELGFCGLYATEECGGLGLSRLDSSLIFEELSFGCTSTTAYITIHNMCTWMVSRFGSDYLRAEFAPRMCSGELLASYCLTEPNAGSDAASLKTTARREGDHYILNGSKAFISGAGSSDVLVLMARTGESGARGISCFLIPAHEAGVSYGRKEDKMGWNSQPTRTITLENVRIPASHRLGEEGQGFRFAMQGLDGGRLNIASCSLGTAQAALEAAQSHLLTREQFGHAIGDFQALQFRLADMATELIAARQMVRLAAWKLDQKDMDATTYCAMAKRFATDACFKICNDALQLHGGYGYIRDYPLERHVRDTRVHQILEGTNEIMRVIIARRLLTRAMEPIR